VTTALQSSHPKTWMEDQRVLHYFISSINNFSKPLPIQPETTVNDEEERVTDPLLTNYGQPENQTNILVQIAEAEEASLELEPTMSNLDLSTSNLENNLNDSNVEEVRNEVVEETLIYTDPVGNTFEAPVIDVVELNRETQMSVIVVESEDTEEDFAFDFSDDEDDDGEVFF